ncbi:MAG: radical SAM protein [Candidatus Riflebacteria bacterium]|nr:radical SAM protein [Candidatus Riflebacteria bacterium]
MKSNQKLLLTSVFKPFSVDDEYGVKENVCELMHNQVTRRQGVFSVRSHNRSFGLSLIAENLKVPTTVLDFPTIGEFVRELCKGQYTHVGISFIVPNVDKARRLAELTREHAPGAKILLGGHGARIPGIAKIVQCDDICIGEGIRWLRQLFGEDVNTAIVHPVMPVDCKRALLGVPTPNRKAILIPGVGCANKCEFCCTSHFFDGYTPFFNGPEDMFAAMEMISDRLKTSEFFVLDENFLDEPARVEKLIGLMKKHRRPFIFDIFSSLRAISQYDPVTLVQLGVQFIWIGVESRRGLFEKTRGIDPAPVIRALRDHGISVLASSILFLEHHDQKSLWDDVDFTIGLEPDFIQFMELAPLPGTALYKRLEAKGRIRHEIPWREWHGQDTIWFDHPHFNRRESKHILDSAFDREYQILGPSLLRIAETRLRGLAWHPPAADAWLNARYAQMRDYAAEMRPLLPALARFAPNDDIRCRARAAAKKFVDEFGPMSLGDRISGAIVMLAARLEQRRIRQGRSVLQPPTFIDRYRQ